MMSRRTSRHGLFLLRASHSASLLASAPSPEKNKGLSTVACFEKPKYFDKVKWVGNGFSTEDRYLSQKRSWTAKLPSAYW